MKTYITFGQVHAHSVNGRTFDKDCVAVIEGEDENACRKIAHDSFGPKWAFSYPEDEFNKKKDKMMKFFPRGFINLNF